MRNMFKVNNRSTRCCSVVCFLLILKIKMVDDLLYCLNLNLSMHFRVRSRSPVTFKAKLYVTTVNNSFQPLPIFCRKELHLRCCIGLELNIVIWSAKILKGIGVQIFWNWLARLWTVWKESVQKKRNTINIVQYSNC